MIITQTPFRMSFFGGGTDMEGFFREHGGAVLSTTFDKYCYVNVRHLPRFFDYSTELSYSKTERVTNIDDIQHPAIRNAMKMLDIIILAFAAANRHQHVGNLLPALGRASLVIYLLHTYIVTAMKVVAIRMGLCSSMVMDIVVMAMSVIIPIGICYFVD